MKLCVKISLCLLIIGMCCCVSFTVPAQKKADSVNLKNVSYQNELNKYKILTLDSSLTDIRNQLKNAKQSGFENFLTTASFLEVAVGTCDNIRTLIFKESYRTKISGLNNPASNDLGFNLQLEIQNALKPLLDKTAHTDRNKFTNILGTIINTGARSAAGLVSSGNIFSSVISLVGNLSLSEKRISKNDLDSFIITIGKYFGQYERLYRAGQAFSNDIEKLKSKLIYCQEDIKNLLLDLIVSYNKNETRTTYRDINTEDLMLQFFDRKKFKEKIENLPPRVSPGFPPDAIKNCKDIATNLQRLYNEYIVMYDNNYAEIRAIILQTKTVSNSIDQNQVSKTLQEVENLYNESKQADLNSLKLKTLSARLEQFNLN